jgi:translation initiation factor IF-1
MAKEETIKTTGIVEDVLPNALFKVKLEEYDSYVLGHLAGKLRTNRINIVMGDRVDIEITPYDLTKARITYRHKK